MQDNIRNSGFFFTMELLTPAEIGGFERRVKEMGEKDDILTLVLFYFPRQIYFMSNISFRKIKKSDKNYFTKWWRDKELLELTSGILREISDREIDKYFQKIRRSKKDRHFMITMNGKAIGHASLMKRRNDWRETQIIMGEKKYRGRGFGPKAIKLLIKKAERVGISKIYLEVRPSNIRAIRAYKHCGFRKTKIILYPKNKQLPKTLRMELKQIK